MITTGRIFDHWTVPSVDSVGRRALCRCSCTRVMTVSTEALVSGASTSCGCRPLRRSQRDAFYAEQAERHRDRDWRR
jgi:hypothetical protein